jgi:hypothetical protein
MDVTDGMDENEERSCTVQACFDTVPASSE